MKTFEEFVKALKTDETLKAKVKEAFETAEAKSEEKKIALLVKIAGENGFSVSTEDFAKQKSNCQELDEDELKLVTGAGEGICFADYGCIIAWNTCEISNESVGFCDNLLW